MRRFIASAVTMLIVISAGCGVPRSVSWENAQRMIAACQIREMVELRDGSLQLITPAGDRIVVRDSYVQESLFMLSERSQKNCGFSATVRME